MDTGDPLEPRAALKGRGIWTHSRAKGQQAGGGKAAGRPGNHRRGLSKEKQPVRQRARQRSPGHEPGDSAQRRGKWARLSNRLWQAEPQVGSPPDRWRARGGAARQSRTEQVGSRQKRSLQSSPEGPSHLSFA